MPFVAPALHPAAPSASAERPVRFRALAWTSGLLAVLTGARLLVEALTRNRLLLDHPSGAWATLADDLLHGTFYRPVESALGWGGTRYPPLYPLLYAGVARVLGSLPPAAELLEALSLVALVGCTFLLLERLGVRRRLALPGALVVLALVPVQALLGLGKADLLASALAMAGLVVATREGTLRREMATALLFSLAVLTKWTVVGGFLAWVTHAWVHGRRRVAIERAALVGGMLLIGIGAAQLSSGGQMLRQLRECAGGGGGPVGMLTAPNEFLQQSDPIDLALLVLAAGALAAAAPGTWRTLPALALLWTWLCTLAVFASPGIAENHLVDVTVLALVLFLTLVDRGAVPSRFAAVVLPLYIVLAVSRFAPEAVEGVTRTPRPAEVLARLGSPAEGPLLAENPWVPLLAGERPVLADAFTFRILALKHPELMRHLVSDLEARRFRAVVLRWPADDADGRQWYDGTHFGPGFVEALRRSYTKVASFRTRPRAYWTHDVWTPQR
ncbi:MAG TPA: hypothetical protein VMT11_12630 [Myxococcaceae bacterium]|nr:hypothetical protein [Myxococcaceae bacterium]